MEPKISVIVPVYNIEKYLSECLDSIAAQTLEGIQVILVDDGSEDSSGKICRDFAAAHPNFEYHYKENGGTASARNMGLEYASGEYIGFVDSDDWIEPEMFETMYRVAKEADADILFCKMAGLGDYVDVPAGVYDKTGICDVIYPSILPHVIPSGTFRTMDWGNWSRLYRRKMVHGNHIQFCNRSRRCEDFAFSVECAIHADCYAVLNGGELYHYRPNENSKSRSYSKNMWQSIRSLMSYMIEITSNCDIYDFSAAMQMCVFYFCTSVIRNEMRLADSTARTIKIQEIITDSLCIEAVNRISPAGMNGEYTAIYGYVKNQDAEGLNRYLSRLAWKKKHITPVLDKVFQNQTARNLYLKIRGR